MNTLFYHTIPKCQIELSMKNIKETIIKDTAIYSIANYITIAIGMVTSIALKAILGTVGAGYWAIVKLFIGYSGLSDLGVRDAALREITQSFGANDQKKAASVLSVSFGFTVITSLLAAVIVFFLSFLINDRTLRASIWITAIVVLATQGYNFALTLLRTFKLFSNLSQVIILNIIFIGFFSIIGAYLFGVIGLTIGTLIATVFSAYFAYRPIKTPLRFIFDFSEIKKLIKIGFPLVLVGYAFETFLNVDAIMIGKMLSFDQLGLYTIALMAIQQVNSFARFAQIVLMPHIQERYGRTSNLQEIAPLFLRSTNAFIFIVPIMIGIVYFIAPMIVYYLIPKFMNGVGAMRILVLAFYFVAVNEMTLTILFTINKQKFLIPLFLVAIGIACGLNYITISCGYGIEGVASATAISYFIFFLLVFSYGFSHILCKKNLIKQIIKIVSLFTYLTFTIFAINKLVVITPYWFQCVCQLLIFVIFQLPPLIYFEKNEKVLGKFWELAKRKFAGN